MIYMMKRSYHYSSVLFILLLLSSTYLSSLSSASAPLLPTHQLAAGNQLVKLSETKYGGEDNIERIMGAEVCDSGDEECLKRRIVSEAHLDYIYTQHHKP